MQPDSCVCAGEPDDDGGVREGPGTPVLLAWEGPREGQGQETNCKFLFEDQGHEIAVGYD